MVAQKFTILTVGACFIDPICGHLVQEAEQAAQDEV